VREDFRDEAKCTNGRARGIKSMNLTGLGETGPKKKRRKETSGKNSPKRPLELKVTNCCQREELTGVTREKKQAGDTNHRRKASTSRVEKPLLPPLPSAVTGYRENGEEPFTKKADSRPKGRYLTKGPEGPIPRREGEHYHL